MCKEYPQVSTLHALFSTILLQPNGHLKKMKNHPSASKGYKLHGHPAATVALPIKYEWDTLIT